MFECRIHENEFPKEGEVVIGKITEISNGSVKMELLEYGNKSGLILHCELSKKRFKNIAQVTKVGNIEVCQVLKIEEAKNFIDLSLKRVSDIEKQECKDKFSQNKLVYQIMVKVAKIVECNVKDLYENWGYEKAAKYGTLFEFFSKANDDLSILDSEPEGSHFAKVISEYFQASSFKVRADIEIINPKYGVPAIKAAFKKVLDMDSELDIALLKSPIFSIVKTANNKDEAFGAIDKACSILKEEVESNCGEFSIVNPAKIYGEKTRFTALGSNKTAEQAKNEDESSEEN